QVHDELVLEVDKDDLEEQKPLVKKVMEQAAPLKIPLKVNVASGENWESAHS
ncbi:MAG: hypothetical protein KDD22_06980, partial [Bdellovibrionales bacterium]|nr:hypothetical protein [Bdellovibrionales bacterium]